VGDVRNDVDELAYIESTDKDETGHVALTLRFDKLRCLAQPKTFKLNTATMEVQASEKLVDVSAVVESQRRAKEDAPLIAHITDTLRPMGMSHTKLVDCVMGLSGKSRSRVREVVDRYSSDDPATADALWMGHSFSFAHRGADRRHFLGWQDPCGFAELFRRSGR
jgi:hypothetical protein